MSPEERAQRAYKKARRRGDLVAVVEAVLPLGRPIRPGQMAKALDALAPHLDTTTARLRDDFPPAEVVDRPSQLDDDRTLPVSFTANLDRAERVRVWRLLVEHGERSLVDAARHVNPPVELVPTIVESMFENRSKHAAPKLGGFSEVLAAYHQLDANASANWYANWIAVRGNVIGKIADAPLWVAALHSEEQLGQLVRVLINHIED